MPVMPDAAVFAACPMIKLTPQREIAPFTSRCIPTMMLGCAAVRKIRRSYPVHHVQCVRLCWQIGESCCEKQRNDQTYTAKIEQSF